MNRREFSRKIRAQAFARSNGCCEHCGAKLKAGEAEFDHVLPCELGGEPTLENCEVLCRPCHKPKTASDIRRIRKADRIRDKHSGAWPKSSRPLCGRNSFKQKIGGHIVPRKQDRETRS